MSVAKFRPSAKGTLFQLVHREPAGTLRNSHRSHGLLQHPGGLKSKRPGLGSCSDSLGLSRAADRAALDPSLDQILGAVRSPMLAA